MQKTVIFTISIFFVTHSNISLSHSVGSPNLLKLVDDYIANYGVSGDITGLHILQEGINTYHDSEARDEPSTQQLLSIVIESLQERAYSIYAFGHALRKSSLHLAHEQQEAAAFNLLISVISNPGVPQTLKQLGDTLLNVNALRSATITFEAIIRLAISTNDRRSLVYGLLGLGDIAKKKNDSAEAEKKYSIALIEAEPLK